MSKNESLIRGTIELLQEVRVQVQGDVEDSVVAQLDEALRMLEDTCHSRPDQVALQEVLELLGKAVKVIPAVVELIELFRHLG